MRTSSRGVRIPAYFRGNSEQKSAVKSAAFLIAKAIQKQRVARGWSQDELARRIGYDSVTVSAWECGAQTARLKLLQLVLIANVFEMTLVQFIAVGADFIPIRSDDDRRRDAKRLSNRGHISCTPGHPAMCEECTAIWKQAQSEAV